MKMKQWLSGFTAAAVTASCLLSATATAFAQEDIKYSPEYKSSPFYEKLTLALENSADKTTMEKTLAVALSIRTTRPRASTLSRRERTVCSGQARSCAWTKTKRATPNIPAGRSGI